MLIKTQTVKTTVTCFLLHLTDSGRTLGEMPYVLSAPEPSLIDCVLFSVSLCGMMGVSCRIGPALLSSLGYLLIDGVRVILCKRKYLGLCDDVLNSADVNVTGLILF